MISTDHASKLLEGNESIAAKINILKNSGSRFSISTSILGELFFAAYASRRKEENLSINYSMVKGVIDAGARRAHEAASTVMEEVREVIGL